MRLSPTTHEIDEPEDIYRTLVTKLSTRQAIEIDRMLKQSFDKLMDLMEEGERAVNHAQSSLNISVRFLKSLSGSPDVHRLVKSATDLQSFVERAWEVDHKIRQLLSLIDLMSESEIVFDFKNVLEVFQRDREEGGSDDC